MTESGISSFRRLWVPAVLTVFVAVAGLSARSAHALSGPGQSPVGDAAAIPVEARDATVPSGGQEEIGALFDRGWPLALLAVFLIGLALNLTPCVYPMLAVTVSIFGGRDGGGGSRRVFGRALVYVLGIASMYSVLGVAAALTGGLFGGILQSRAVLIGIAVLFAGLALSMFGLYELRLPLSWTGRLGGTGQAGIAGAYVSGLLVGVFAAPCIGPPIIALLALVGQRADPLFGFVIFFVLSLGLGAPYLVLGTFSGLLRKMPRSGEWMVWVRKLFGVIMMGVAAFYLALASRPDLVFILIPVILAAGGIYLGFIESSRTAGRWFKLLKPLTGVAVFAVGAVLFQTGRKPSLEWTPYPAEGAAAAGRPAVVYFSADWCIPCLELDRRTFTDAEVIRELNRYALFKVDITHSDTPESRELIERYDIVGVPTIAFLDGAGSERRGLRRVGFVAASDMLDHLNRVRARAAVPAAPLDPAAVAGDEDMPSRAYLVSDAAWIQPGRTFRLGVLFRMQAQWHVYWMNPGDSGTPPAIDWRMPEGFRAGAVAWPFPQRFEDGPFATFGHEDELLLAREIVPPEDLEPGTTVTFEAAADWLVCREICIAQDDFLSLRLEVRDEPPPSGRRSDAFERAAARVPVVDESWSFSVAAESGGYLLAVTPPGDFPLAALATAEFFPGTAGFLRTGPYVWRIDGAGARLRLARDTALPPDNRLQGVLVLPQTETAGGRPRAVLIDATLPD